VAARRVFARSSSPIAQHALPDELLVDRRHPEAACFLDVFDLVAHRVETFRPLRSLSHSGRKLRHCGSP
jgi:hypothetical protein